MNWRGEAINIRRVRIRRSLSMLSLSLRVYMLSVLEKMSAEKHKLIINDQLPPYAKYHR
jgi:hypothetical protein